MRESERERGRESESWQTPTTQHNERGGVCNEQRCNHPVYSRNLELLAKSYMCVGQMESYCYTMDHNEL